MSSMVIKFIGKITTLIVIICLVGCGRNSLEIAGPNSIVNSKLIIDDLNWQDVSDLIEDSPIKNNSIAVALLSIPRKQSRCTGFLVAPNIIMTNNHCVPSNYFASGVKATFDYESEKINESLTTFSCDKLLLTNTSLDFSLLECSNFPADFVAPTPLILSDIEMNTNDEIYIIHQNCDYYLKSDCDSTKKFSEGLITEYNWKYAHNADTLGGSSGSPMFSKDTNKVVGIHHAGYGNNGYGRGVENYAIPMSSIIEFLNSKKSEYSFINNILAAPLEKFEPNESFNSPYFLDLMDSFSQNLSIKSNDIDYFKFETKQDSFVVIKLTFNHQQGDLDIKLFSEDENLLAFSNSIYNEEYISLVVPKGSYILKVYGHNQATNNYQLDIEEYTF